MKLPRPGRARAQVIENILDDDQDMEDMNLGARADTEDKFIDVIPPL